ncbi:uncharacterized protein MYCFIDRAFT_210920 [Pseudocercospora fijiensis CIRAD86]|uniref:Uncharacterized protein n=1 Tax=Pseudocercospora fijiensis (strain CIRAD86) TaxID=383855 RepID=M3B5G0_PSEFD|nr:uncharacterized protein MYCFIDRAFT_210920 [Pseudocercospora fijiensis CIRAD86]EME84597.1 hypothetical protein MYCFIDRAFT_210920 [Pseudocercospora fijiensis CIRAD86]
MASQIMSTLQQTRSPAVAEPEKKQRKRAKSDLVAGQRYQEPRQSGVVIAVTPIATPRLCHPKAFGPFR